MVHICKDDTNRHYRLNKLPQPSMPLIWWHCRQRKTELLQSVKRRQCNNEYADSMLTGKNRWLQVYQHATTILSGNKVKGTEILCQDARYKPYTFRSWTSYRMVVDGVEWYQISRHFCSLPRCAKPLSFTVFGLDQFALSGTNECKWQETKKKLRS